MPCRVEPQALGFGCRGANECWSRQILEKLKQCWFLDEAPWALPSLPSLVNLPERKQPHTLSIGVRSAIRNWGCLSTHLSKGVTGNSGAGGRRLHPRTAILELWWRPWPQSSTHATRCKDRYEDSHGRCSFGKTRRRNRPHASRRGC